MLAHFSDISLLIRVPWASPTFERLRVLLQTQAAEPNIIIAYDIYQESRRRATTIEPLVAAFSRPDTPRALTALKKASHVEDRLTEGVYTRENESE